MPDWYDFADFDKWNCPDETWLPGYVEPEPEEKPVTPWEFSPDDEF